MVPRVLCDNCGGLFPDEHVVIETARGIIRICEWCARVKFNYRWDLPRFRRQFLLDKVGAYRR